MGIVVAPRLNSGDVQQLGGIGQRFTEGLYVICVDSSNNPTPTPQFVVNHHQQHATAALETSEPDVESPPSYEEATSLINHEMDLF
jgi:hypothetical protein